MLKEEAKKEREAAKKGEVVKAAAVARIELEPDETCCVCYDTMNKEENLTFCRQGCGKNIHTECMERWVRHKVQNRQEITCPLCRISWGDNVLE